VGFNSYDFKFEYLSENGSTDVLVNKNVGFNVGLIGDARINDYINLRLEPTLIMTERELIFPGFVDESDYLRSVRTTYIHVPLLVKFSTKRLNNIKPFVVGGLSNSFNISANEDHPEDNSVGRFRMMSSALNYELGFGIDIYMYFFKFTPSIRGVFAITDELVRDFDPNSPHTSNISSMKSRGVFINFTFQ
ncbi:MAG TPA: porin family protein, partial [Flavobacteriaceae bacterium]|nr:porin family protein [Flavobacteriaceae bacterium]